MSAPLKKGIFVKYGNQLAGNFVMGGILLGTFELPLSSQEEDQLSHYDSTEG